MDKLLQQFLAIAEAGSISGATAGLYVTQPTLTFNMRKLEESLGVKLFVRSSQGMRLTAYGETLYENARLMRRLYDNTINALENQRLRTERGLSIGCGYSWWSLLVRDMVLNYAKEFPNAPIQVSLGNQLRCMDQLLSGDISLFIGHEILGLNAATSTEFLALTSVHSAFYVRAGHPLLGQPRERSEIDAFPGVSSTPPETRHQRFFDAMQRQDRATTLFDRTHFAFGSNSLAACIDYVCATDAVLGHTSVMADEFAKRDIHKIELSVPQPAETVGIYVLAERIDDERVADLIGRIRELALIRLGAPT
ncbi:LysR family transcriptional regulator [Devosia rhodophyticola]|uniref:LysR family transcriptional regulator n=1 Tax=Devosia rhodophyticola TaxID=3026423 RepID=A0ABY7Z280_9HYPH|nr:LysR family transcriptional regulator [Devosia rhodophyticola]WDR07209.1 LysR family transcriptional regulator [Devosia rhodophyticola]